MDDTVHDNFSRSLDKYFLYNVASYLALKRGVFCSELIHSNSKRLAAPRVLTMIKRSCIKQTYVFLKAS